MSGRMKDLLFCMVLIGATSFHFTEAVDNQMLTFLLNEMSNYRTSSMVMENDIKQLKAALTNLTSQNAQLQQLVTSLNSKCNTCEQNLMNNVSKLNTDIQVIAKATNISVLFIDREQAVFEDRIEKLLLNHTKIFKAQIENRKYFFSSRILVIFIYEKYHVSIKDTNKSKIKVLVYPS